MGRGSGKGREGGALLEGLGGTVQGSFFKPPLWVDQAKQPGHSDQTASGLTHNPDWWALLSGRSLVFSPNLVWLAVALLDYFCFPYDYEAAKTWAVGWVAYRAVVNVCIVFGYFGFWHVSLYWLGFGSRPFKPDRKWSWHKLLHNTWYTLMGALQWTVWEAAVVHCYATGRLPYLSDEQAFSSVGGAVQFALAIFLVPIYRELHFYFAHRLIHTKFMYKYVHALHHRNTDIEPFAGLCMHPIEHLYYFSCCGPSLYLFGSPFGFLWNGIHLLISPAASHSGYEDNFQSDQFHYLHHRFFECNYGTGTFPFDYWFGTFRESLNPDSKMYTGEHKESKEIKMDSKSAASHDAKATLFGSLPTSELIFNVVCCLLIPALLLCATLGLYGADQLQLGPVSNGQLIGFLMAFGPVLLGLVLLLAITKRPQGFNHPLYPFHKDWKGLVFHLLVGQAVAVLPVYHAVHTLLAPPGQAVYFQLWSQS